MDLTKFFGLYLLCLLVQRTANLPFLSKRENAIADETALNSLLANFKNFNASNLFQSFRLPACVQDCVNEMGNTLASLNFEERWSLEKTKVTCRQFDAMKKCLAGKPECSSMLIEIGVHAFNYFCSDDEAHTGLIPCIRRETLTIHAACERACKLGATLLDAASLNARSSDVLNFLDEKGNKILTVPDLHQLCNSSTCFLSCMRAGIEEKCPNGGSAFVDNIMNSLMKEVTNNHLLPETRVVDAYTSMVSSFLPRQCQYLILQEKDIILTTPGAPFTFITTAHDLVQTFTPSGIQKVTSSIPTNNEAKAVEVERNRNLKADSPTKQAEDKNLKRGSSATVATSLALILSMIVMTSVSQ